MAEPAKCFRPGAQERGNCSLCVLVQSAHLPTWAEPQRGGSRGLPRISNPQAYTQHRLCEQVVVELAVACTSAGDAFRSLDQKDLVKNTFVLVSGDVVTNMDLAAAYREHRERRQASPAAILTLARRSALGP